MQDWKSNAEKAGLSISRFVMDRVEDSLRREEREEKADMSRIQLIKKLKQAEEENRRLSEENRLLKRLAEKLDRELRRYRMQPFAEQTSGGSGHFQRS
ncbi:MAG: hypothetical protein QXV32_09550 [Conexivisphaerales archaeon]